MLSSGATPVPIPTNTYLKFDLYYILPLEKYPRLIFPIVAGSISSSESSPLIVRYGVNRFSTNLTNNETTSPS
jgi:hypothetical protein